MMADPNGTARCGEADPFRMGRIGVPKSFKKASIGVFWDMEQCHLPAFCDGAEIAEKIKSAVSSWGYKGKVHINVIGDPKFITPDVEDDLQSAGIVLRHIHSEEGRTHLQVFIEMIGWLWGVRGPVNILFISKISKERCLVAESFSEISSKYNFIQKSIALGTVDAAKYFWDWSDLLDGQSQSLSEVCSCGGNECEDFDNNYYQYKQAERDQRREKRYLRTAKKTSKPRVKASLSSDSLEEKNMDRKAKNYHYQPY